MNSRRVLAGAIGALFVANGVTLAAGQRGDDGADAAATTTTSITSRSTTSTTAATTTSSSSTSTTATTKPTTTSTAVAPPSLAGSVLFIANRGSPAEVPTTGPVTPGSGGYNIWVMNADGHEERALTTTSHDAQPALAPDGVHIAWIVSNNQVWTMTSDGAAQKKVASCPQACGTPRWSPDGTRIAYTAQSGNGDVVVIDADGAHPRQYKTAIDAYGVSWSPDGQRLAVNVSGAPDVAGLWVMSVATGVEKRIRTGNTAAPAWSPDGSTILFSDGTNLFTMAPDGTGLKQRTSGGGQYLGGSWSRDGHTLVFDFFPGRAGAHQQVGSMGVDGSNLRALTDGTDDCYESTT